MFIFGSFGYHVRYRILPEAFPPLHLLNLNPVFVYRQRFPPNLHRHAARPMRLGNDRSGDCPILSG
jgi:hypothetical protein